MNPQVNPIMQMAPIFFIMIIMYFMLIRPQMKQQKELAKMQSDLKKNDEVITSGGIHGTVVNVKDGVVTVRVDENVRLDIEKTAIARVVKAG